MNAKNNLLPAITGTSLMTLFSDFISKLEKSNFNESELLADIEKKYLPSSVKQLSLPAAWITHYSVGIVMTSLFNIIWQTFKIKSTFKRSMILGTVGGLIAIYGWKILFKALPSHSRSYYRRFYTQLFIAHFVFAYIVTITQKIGNHRDNLSADVLPQKPL